MPQSRPTGILRETPAEQERRPGLFEATAEGEHERIEDSQH
jgi:hypothetical protein